MSTDGTDSPGSTGGTDSAPAKKAAPRKAAAKKAPAKKASGSKPILLDGVGEWRSGPAAGTALVRGVNFTQKGLIFAKVDGKAIFEGDIILGRADEVGVSANAVGDRSIGITGANFRWPGAKLPYVISSSLTNQQRVTDAIAHWEANTRVRFELRTSSNASQFPDYISFEPSGGCASAVGKQGGKQVIELGTNCSTGNCIHEVGHALGLWHEQSREDRDSFIKVLWANISTGKDHNFSQHVSDGDDIGAYDFGSIMHYPLTAFSKNGQPTLELLVTAPTGVTIGQRSALSAGDIAGINALYPRRLVTRAETTSVTRWEATSIKEVAKDPVMDVTRKELAMDNIQFPVPTGWNMPSFMRRDMPFVMGAPSGFPEADAGGQGGPGDFGGDEALAAVANQLGQIGQAIADLSVQQAQLTAAYDATVAALYELSAEGE